MTNSIATSATYDSITRINSLIAVEQQPLTALRTQRANVDAASTSISSFASKLSSLSSAADALAEPDAIYEMTATSSDAGVVASVARSGTSVSAFSVSVAQVATEQRMTSYAKSTESDRLNMSGELELRVGSTVSTLTIEATDSLADIAKKIDTSGQRVTASVTYGPDGYKLSIRGLDTGAANKITINEVGEGPKPGTNSVLMLGLWRPSNISQAAQDAQFTVDGVAGTSATNQVKDVVPGVTLALRAATSATANVAITSEAVVHTKLTSFVDAFNGVIDSGRSVAGLGGQAASVPSLAGNPGVKVALDRISDLLLKESAGASGAYTTLDSIGLSADETGRLHLDGARLASAIAADRESVARIFAPAEGSNGLAGVMASFHETVADLNTSSSSVVQRELTGLVQQAAVLKQGEKLYEDRIGAYQTTLQELLATLASELTTPPT